MLRKPLYGRLFFEADKGDDAGNGAKADEDSDGKESQNANAGGEQGEGFKPITSEAELSAYKASLRKSIAEDVKRQFEDDQKRRDEQARVERERQEAEAKGEFETVKASLVKERDDAIGERDALKAKVEAYEALAKTRVEEGRKALPAEAVEDFPADADALAQLTWLEGRAALVAKLLPSNGKGAAKLPTTPEANGNPPALTKEQQAAYDRQFARSF